MGTVDHHFSSFCCPLALRQLVRHHPGEDPALHDLAETWPFFMDFMGEMVGKMAPIGVHPHFETHFSGGSTSWDNTSLRQLPWPNFLSSGLQWHDFGLLQEVLSPVCGGETSGQTRRVLLHLGWGGMEHQRTSRLNSGYPGHCFQNGTAWSGPNWLPAKLTVLQWLGLKSEFQPFDVFEWNSSVEHALVVTDGSRQPIYMGPFESIWQVLERACHVQSRVFLVSQPPTNPCPDTDRSKRYRYSIVGREASPLLLQRQFPERDSKVL